jgi:hypothetical protein
VHEPDSPLQPVPLGIAAGKFEGVIRQVHSDDVRLRDCVRYAHRDHAGACADVSDFTVAGAVASQKIDSDLDEHLGFRPGYDRGGRDFKLEAEEFLVAQDVRRRLVDHASHDQPSIGFFLLGR